MYRTIILYWIIFVGLPFHGFAYEGQLQPNDRLLITSHTPKTLLTLNRDGQRLWKSEVKIQHPQQVSALPDGRVFCATGKGAIMLNQNGEPKWTYQVPKGAENATALFISPDRYLVSHEGLNELVELNGEGNIILKTSLAPLNPAIHGQFRYTGYGDGHYLVTRMKSATFQEIEPKTGLVIWELKNMQTVTSALRRSDGGTYICTNNTLNSYSKERVLEWKIDLKADFGLKKAVPPLAMVQLPKGNLIISLYHGDEDIPHLIEVDPEKKSLVHSWKIDGIKNAAGVAYLPASHLFFK